MKYSFLALGLAAALLVSPAFAKEDMEGHPMHQRDGFVTKDEFLSNAQHNFDRSDTDGDGKLSKEERRAAFEKMKAKRAKWREKHGSEHEENGHRGGHGSSGGHSSSSGEVE